ncbi:hypothetical protein Taro_018293 [Colocasia esculenta]|uniref:Uncharacterized protein n=1 Tax=Colocasia esculenta TaxID=4460 RepID=A0A843UQC8_COLES|nr:hypothetical protein [Colocasia esculenta]
MRNFSVVTPRPPWALGPVLWVVAGQLSQRGSDRVDVWFCLVLRQGVCRLLEDDIPIVAFWFDGWRHGVCCLLEGDMAYVAFPSCRPRRRLTDVTGVLCVSTALAVSGCLPRVEAAVLRRVTLRSCRGRVRAVRCEEEMAKPTRRPQRVHSSRGGRDIRLLHPKHDPLPV